MEQFIIVSLLLFSGAIQQYNAEENEYIEEMDNYDAPTSSHDQHKRQHSQLQEMKQIKNKLHEELLPVLRTLHKHLEDIQENPTGPETQNELKKLQSRIQQLLLQLKRNQAYLRQTQDSIQKQPFQEKHSEKIRQEAEVEVNRLQNQMRKLMNLLQELQQQTLDEQELKTVQRKAMASADPEKCDKFHKAIKQRLNTRKNLRRKGMSMPQELAQAIFMGPNGNRKLKEGASRKSSKKNDAEEVNDLPLFDKAANKKIVPYSTEIAYDDPEYEENSIVTDFAPIPVQIALKTSRIVKCYRSDHMVICAGPIN